MDTDAKQLNPFSGRLLAAFLTLEGCGQFKVAAERFNVTQSAFSQMIARLELQLGVRLFERGPRRITLTPEGRMLVPVARQLAASVGAMYADMKDHAQGRRGRVAFAALPSLCADWAPELMAKFRASHPGIHVRLFDTGAEESLELVRQGTADFAISARVDSAEEFDTLPLFEEPLFLICPPGHPLAARRSIALSQLQGCDYIHTNRRGSVWQTLEPHVRGIDLRDTGLEVGQFSTLAGLIANGAGVSISTAFALFQFYRVGLVAVRIRDQPLRRTVVLVKRRGAQLSVAATALKELMAANAPKPASARAARAALRG